MCPSTRYSRIHASRPWVASRKRKKPRRKVMRSNPGAEKEPVMTKVREVLVYRGFLEEGQFRPYTEVVADQSVELRNNTFLGILSEFAAPLALVIGIGLALG